MKKVAVPMILLGCLLLMPLVPAFAQAADEGNSPTKTSFCMECIRIRVGIPFVARGPGPNTVDNYFSVIQLPNGRFRGFTAAAESYAIDGPNPWDMYGPAVTVLKPGPPGSPSSCGQGLMQVEPAGKKLLGFISNETVLAWASRASPGPRRSPALPSPG